MAVRSLSVGKCWYPGEWRSLSSRLGAPSPTGDVSVWVLGSTVGSSPLLRSRSPAGGGWGGGLSGVGRVGVLFPFKGTSVLAVDFLFF